MKHDHDIFLAVSIEGLDSVIAANIATGCLDGVHPIYSSLYPGNDWFMKISCKRLACLSKGKDTNFSNMISNLGSYFF